MSSFVAIPTSWPITPRWRARRANGRSMRPTPRRSPAAGGCDFDPKANPALSDLIWTPAALPTVAVLTRLPPGLVDPSFGIESHALHAILAAEADDQSVDLGGEGVRVHREGDVGESVAVLLPLDRLFDIRAAAALRFWRGLVGRAPGPDVGALTSERRNRLILALRALDGRLDGASYPEIAAALFDTEAISKRDWISHELRDQTGRLVRLGFSMMRSGYRQLLLYPYRRRS
jgi:hypothetical protein